MYQIGTVLLTTASNSAYLISTTITDAGSVNVNTIPAGTRIHNIQLVSSSSASTLNIYNGSSAATPTLVLKGTSNANASFDFGFYGHTFPNGAWVVTDGNIVSAAIACGQQPM